VKEFILKFLVPFAVAVAIFGGLMVYQHGWDRMTYGGSDPWGLLFEGECPTFCV